MPLPIQQLKGNLKMGVLTADLDVSEWVTKMVIHRSRASIDIPATLATGESGTAAGAAASSLEIDYFSSLAATSIWHTLYTALGTDTSELLFEGTLDPGVVGADNPKWTGTIVILGVDTGGTVGGLRTYSTTFPIKPGTLVMAVI